MTAKPELCPSCGTFVRASWTTVCVSCGVSLFIRQAVEPAEGSAPAPSAPTQVNTAARENWQKRSRKPQKTAAVSKKELNAAIVIAAGLVAVVLVGGILMFSESGAKPLASPGDSSGLGPNPTTTTTSPSVFGESLFLPSSAFNSKWKSSGIEHSTATQLASTGCFPGDTLMKNVAIVNQTYVYNEQANGQAGGTLTHSNRISNSTAAAKHQHERINSQQYEACAISNAKETMLAAAGQGAFAENVKLERVLRKNLAVPYVSYRVTAKVRSKVGINNTTTK